MHAPHPVIGLLGGTFDPIHHGHLRMALELYESLTLTRVHLIPCFQPVHRPAPIASPEDRLAMVKQAIANEPALSADDREIRRQGPSYTLDTLMQFRAEMPTASLCLLLGIDAFLGLPTWHHFEKIFDLAHVIVAHRPNYQLPTTGAIATLMATHLQHKIEFIHQHASGGILLQPITALEISATDIRKQIAMQGNPRYLLPDPVYDYIKKHGIYHH